MKIFSSSMDATKAEYFYREVKTAYRRKIILPAVRKSIADDKRLNCHYY